MSGSDAIPEFHKTRAGDGQDVSLTNLSAFSSGPGIKSARELVAILVVAVVVIGGVELALGDIGGDEPDLRFME